MNFLLIKIRTRHLIENVRSKIALALSLIKLENWANQVKPKRQKDIETVFDSMTEAETRNLLRSKGKGSLALYQMYKKKYLHEPNDEKTKR